MRVEKTGNTGFACVRDFLRSGLAEQIVTLRAADRRDVRQPKVARAKLHELVAALPVCTTGIEAESGTLNSNCKSLYNTGIPRRKVAPH